MIRKMEYVIPDLTKLNVMSINRLNEYSKEIDSEIMRIKEKLVHLENQKSLINYVTELKSEIERINKFDEVIAWLSFGAGSMEK